jgi:hypothetical protein
MYKDSDVIAWFLVSLVALATGWVVLDEQALDLARVAPLASC